MKKPNGVTKEIISRPEHESSCQYCGEPLYIGDRVYYHEQEFIATCSLDCMTRALQYREDSSSRSFPENMHYCSD